MNLVHRGRVAVAEGKTYGGQSFAQLMLVSDLGEPIVEVGVEEQRAEVEKECARTVKSGCRRCTGCGGCAGGGRAG